MARSNRLCQFDDFVVGWICHESFLDESEGLIGVVEDFVGDVYAELEKRYKPQENGEILFRFPRLFFTATRAR